MQGEAPAGTESLTDAEVDFETAVGDPAAFYADPQAIADDATLSRAQKLRFLTEWAQDLAQRQEADGEGMAPEDGRSAATDAVLMKQVNAALEHVTASSESDVGLAMRSLWKRLKTMAR